MSMIISTSPDRPCRGALQGSIRRQAGLTLIELMVALVLGLLIAAAAVAALIIARTGFTSVDLGAQLRENSRFATSLIQRITIQAGFENAAYGLISDSGAKLPGLRGYDDSLVGDVSAVAATAEPPLAHDTRSGTCAVTDTSCVNGSDVLVVRFWGVSRVPGGAADGSMINCAGIAEAEGTDRAYSIFHVARSASGEPTLACTYRTAAGWRTVPLVTGVEAFQVLYSVDTFNTATGATGQDSVGDRFLTATELDSIPGSVIDDNWRRVRTVRIGLVIRGSTPNAVDPAATAATIPVLGAGFSASADTLSDLAVPADGRLRQSLVFTMHLRNAQFSP